MMKQKLSKLQYEVHLVDHCNLNCQMCDHFSPLADQNYLSPNQYESDVKRLSEIFDHKANYIRLLGGEPLLHPQLVHFFEISRRYFPDADLELYTNGLLIPEQPDMFWKACRNYSVKIAVTKYPIHFDYDTAETIAQNNHVKYMYVTEKNEPVKTSWRLPLDLEGKHNPITNYSKCDMGNVCILLKNGRLYPCTVVPNVVHFNKYFNTNLQVTNNDSIDIYHATADQIRKFLANPIPFCRYCAIENREEDIPWNISQKNIKEWT